MPIRRDLCDEARRLARMLIAHPVGDVPAVHALLALMCFHGARFDARVGLDGAIASPTRGSVPRPSGPRGRA